MERKLDKLYIIREVTEKTKGLWKWKKRKSVEIKHGGLEHFGDAKIYVEAINERNERSKNSGAYIEMSELDGINKNGEYIYKEDTEPIVVYDPKNLSQ